jgi:RNA polymerase sigma-70 factor (ECF subfamily)
VSARDAGVNEREAEWAALMRAARAADTAAYDQFLRAVAAALRPVIRRGLARAAMGPADTEDVVQEILLAVHLKRHTWDATRPIGPWLQAVARHKLIDAVRRGGRRVSVSIDDFMDSIPAPEQEYSMNGADVTHALDRLPAGQRAVVQAIAVEGASVGEVAARLQMSDGSVRVALHRGLSALARQSSGKA